MKCSQRLKLGYLTKIIGFALVLTTFAQSGFATPTQVEAALAWELSSHQCKIPKQRVYILEIEIRVFIREQKAWQRCIREYGNNLLTSFDSLKNSAQYGLTQTQANTILKKMARIQYALEALAQESRRANRRTRGTNNREFTNWSRDTGHPTSN